MKTVQAKKNGSKQPASETRVKVTQTALDAAEFDAFERGVREGQRDVRAFAAGQAKAPPLSPPKITNADAERVVLRHGKGGSIASDATIGDLLPLVFSNEHEHTGLTLAEEALQSLSEDLFILACAMDPHGDLSEPDARYQQAIMRAYWRACAAVQLSKRTRKADEAQEAVGS